MDYGRILHEIARETKPLFGRGKVADYIPALARVFPDRYGMAVCTVDGEAFVYGDAEEPFSTQSISKVTMLTLAFQSQGDRLWKRVGKEPSGRPFHSLAQLEFENGIPRNPFINAGALIVTDCFISSTAKPKQDLLSFVRRLSGNRTIRYDREVARSEKTHGFRNTALANFIKSFGNIKNDVDEVLDLYFHQCSLSMSCLDLARTFLYLANGGILPATNERILTRRQTKRINAIMLTCGMYDGVGDFAYRVGLPGKSGVGGGIIAILPNELSICVWSPRLDQSGNSLIGTKALELFTTKTAKSIF